MSSPKRQKVIDEVRLSEICDDCEKLIALVVRYEQWRNETQKHQPFHNEELKEGKIIDFLHTVLNCPEEFAKHLSKIHIKAMLDGKVFKGWAGPYPFNGFFWGVTDTWAHRNFSELNINGPVSEPLRKRLLVIHGKYKRFICGRNCYYDRNWKPKTELYTLYWLTRPDWRPNFFRTAIRRQHIIDFFKFDPEPIIPLLKPTDNLAFYVLCLDRRDYILQIGNPNVLIWGELERLVPDFKKREDVFYALTGLYNLEDHHPAQRTRAQLKQYLYTTDKAFAENNIVRGFSTRIRSIQWREYIDWLCPYVAIALECDVPIWESLFYFMHYNHPDTSE